MARSLPRHFSHESTLSQWKDYYHMARVDQNNSTDLDEINEDLGQSVEKHTIAALLCKRALIKKQENKIDDAINDYKEALKIDDSLFHAAY